MTDNFDLRNPATEGHNCKADTSSLRRTARAAPKSLLLNPILPGCGDT